jgi:selenide,water dikinase
VSTIDFFPPLVDEPADFGAIAAANACSDIFAMGGEVRLAVNVAAFPEDFPSEIVVEILRAASETVCSVGGVIAGGHTIRNPEPIFGLAVQGVVHPKRIFRKSGARVGDAVVLSKPLGTGLITSGGTQSEISQAIVGMRQTNQLAAAVLRAAGSAVHAVTDVTGFGLAGHAWEIADRSQVVMKIETSSLPLYVGAERLAREGHRTGGGIKNRAYVRNLDGRVDEWLATIATDPETSGGLLAVVDPTSVRQLEASGSFSVIGTCQRGDPRVFLC